MELVGLGEGVGVGEGLAVLDEFEDGVGVGEGVGVGVGDGEGWEGELAAPFVAEDKGVIVSDPSGDLPMETSVPGSCVYSY